MKKIILFTLAALSLILTLTLIPSVYAINLVLPTGLSYSERHTASNMDSLMEFNQTEDGIVLSITADYQDTLTGNVSLKFGAGTFLGWKDGTNTTWQNTPLGTTKTPQQSTYLEIRGFQASSTELEITISAGNTEADLLEENTINDNSIVGTIQFLFEDVGAPFDDIVDGPWTAAHTYGRYTNYFTPTSNVVLRNDDEELRVYVVNDPDTSVTVLYSEIFNDDNNDFAAQSPYTDFTIELASNEAELIHVTNVAAIYLDKPSSGFINEFKIYHYVDTQLQLTTYDWDTSTENNIYAYFSGGLRPVISGNLVMIANVDEEKPLSFFVDLIHAWDDIDGDISDDITVVADDYTANIGTLGTYEITVSVADSEANSSTLTFDIVVVDVTAPSITASGTASESYTSTYNLANYGTTITGTDNYYDPEDLVVTIHSDGYTANKTIPGEYEVVYRVTDPSSNYAEHTLTITVNDDVAPVFTGGVQSLSKDINEIITTAQILATQEVTDAIDGNVTYSIEIISNGYQGNETTPGEYSIVIRAYDSENNMVERTITIEVYSGVPGWWMVNDGPIIIPNGSTLTYEQIISVLVTVNWITPEQVPTVTLLSSDYFGNENVPGTYTLNLSIDGEATEFQLLVLNEGDNWFPDVQNPPIATVSFTWLWWTLGISLLAVTALGSIIVFNKKK